MLLSERGQASVEWTGLLLLVALALGAVVALAPRVEGRSLGAAVARRIACAAGGDCVRAAAGVRPAAGRGRGVPDDRRLRPSGAPVRA